MSRIMGVQGWDGFSERLIRQAFPDYKEQATIIRDIKDSKERITVAYKQFEREGKLKEFYKSFGKALEPDKITFCSKKNIYDTLKEFTTTFLTTNADNLFEEVLGSAVCHEDCNSTLIKNEHLRRQNHLFYLHGHYSEDIDVHNNKLVFTAPQYVRRYNDDTFIEFLKAIFREQNVIIFVGYGLNEFELMDYIVTKAGHSVRSEQKVYVLYGFCEDEDILYSAKKSYFEALNIRIIPYDMSLRGYDALIDVLEKLYDDICRRALVPVIDTISRSIINLNEENYLYIKHCLTNGKQKNSAAEVIVHEIRKGNNFEWAAKFYEDGLFSTAEMDMRLKDGEWPLLGLLTAWLKTDDKRAQDVATRFLQSITVQQKRILSKQYTTINQNIVEIIFVLDKSHIKAKYIDLVRKVVGNNHSFYYELYHIENFERIIQWNVNHIRKLLDLIFWKVDFEEYHDNQSYFIGQFFKKFNYAIKSERIARLVFNYFTEIIKRESKENYVLFMEIHDLDNIYKNLQDYWKLVLDEIKFAFEKVSKNRQYELLDMLVRESDEACWKLALYLARKNDHNIVELIEGNTKLLSSQTCYHEYYLLLKHHMERLYISGPAQADLCTLICEAEFGLGKYDKEDGDDYFKKLILRKRLCLLQCLSCDTAINISNSFLEEKMEPYPTEEVAENCDYVRCETWVNETQLSRETFEAISLEKWGEIFEEICSTVHEKFALPDCAKQFVELVFDRSVEEVNAILPTLKELSQPLLKDVIEAIRSKRENIVSCEVLINMCLDVLELLINEDSINKELAKSIFKLLADIRIEGSEDVARTLDVIRPWLKISVGDSDIFAGSNHLLDNLINYGDFAKFSVLINCYLFLRKNTGYELSDDEIHILLEGLENFDSKKVYRYTLCYNYQNLKYLAQDRAVAFSNALLEGELFDMSALVLCILHSAYVFPELVDTIKDQYLSGCYSLPVECKDRISERRFYEFIVASCYYGRLTMDELKQAYKFSEFVDYFLRSISMWSGKENFVLEEWLVPCWESIKTYYEEKVQNYAELLLHSIEYVVVPTQELLDLYIEVALYCKDHMFVRVKTPKVLEFCNVDVEKALQLAEELIKKDIYIGKEELIVFTQKCAETNRKDNARKLLNELCNEGRIGLEIKEECGALLKREG